MDVLGAVLSTVGVLLVFGVVFAVIAVRSYRRNVYMYSRSPLASVVIAGFAVVLYPWTILYWLVGPTPERRVRH